MSLKMISYDLREPGRDYSSLYKAIESLGANRWHYLESVWFVPTATSTSAVMDMIRPHIDANDKLLVCTIGADWATVGFDAQANQWLRENAR
jgi:hypothetical protein